MSTEARLREITVEDLHADTATIVDSLQSDGGVVIRSASGNVIAVLAPAAADLSLTRAQAAEILKALAAFERQDPATWIEHEEAMRVFDARYHPRRGNA